MKQTAGRPDVTAAARVPLALGAAVAASIVAAGTALADTAPAAPKAATTAFRGGAGHAGAYQVEGPRTFGLAFSVTTDDDVNAGVAVGVDGTAYLVSKDGVVRAVSASGNEVWKATLGAATVGSPVLAADLVIVGGQNGLVKAWRANDGSGAWTSASHGQVIGAVAIGRDDLIWFAASSGRLVALKTDGTLHRVVTMPDDAVGSPAIGADGSIYVATEDRQVRRYSADGDQVHATALPYVPTTPPVVGPDGHVTLGVDTEVIRVDGSNGAITWRKSLGVRVRSMPAVASDNITVVGTEDGRVVAITPDGQTAWTATTGGQVLSAPAIDVAGHVYVGSGDATLYAYDKDGKRFATWRAFDAIDSAITLGPDGTLYAGSRDNRLYALRDGARRFASSPVDRVGGDLVRDAASGRVFAMIDGARRWIPDPVTLGRLGLGSRLPVTLTPAEVSRIPTGPALPALTEGSVIRSSTGAVYRIANGSREWVPEGDANAADAPDQVTRTMPVSPIDGQAIKGTDDRVYVIEGGARRWVRSAADLAARGIAWSGVHLVSDAARDAIPLGDPIG